MTRGLLAPLSPPEEIALRRVANGSPIIDAQLAANLCRLALIERTASGLRLTPLGRQRYEAMPKALLLARRHSLHAVTGYVEGLLEKAQVRARLLQPKPRAASPAIPAGAPEQAEAAGDDDTADAGPPLPDLIELRRWQTQAIDRTEKVRKCLSAQRAKDESLCAASRERIEASRLLLRETMPASPL